MKPTEYDNQGSRPWAEIFVVAVLACFCLAFHNKIIWGGQTFVLKDASRLFYPLWAWSARVWKGGVIPLWNPDAGFGTPSIGDPEIGTWYLPLRLLYAFLGPVDAFNWVLILHHLWAIFGFYAFARGRDFSKKAAFLGAFIFGFSIHGISSFSSSVLLFSFSWVPWVFLCADRLFKGARWSWCLLGLAFGFQLACGFPVVAYLTGLTLVLEKIIGSGSGRHRDWRGFLLLLSALGVGVLFNFAWILPFYEFQGFSNGLLRLSFREDMPSGFAWTWLNPFWLTNPLYPKGEISFELSSYFIGWPALGLILWGILTRRITKGLFLIFIFCFLLSRGGWLGIELANWFPFYQWVVRSGYWMPLVVFLASWLAMDAAEAGMAANDEAGGQGLAWAASGLLIFGMALFSGIPPDLPSFWISGVLFLLAGWKLRLPIRARYGLIAAAAFLSLWPAAQNVNFTMPRSYYEKAPRVLEMTGKPGRLYQSFRMVENAGIGSGRNVSEAYEVIKEKGASNWPLAFGKEECFFYSSFFVQSYFDWCFSSMRFSERVSRQVLDYLSVRYVLGPQHFPDITVLSGKDDPVLLSENPTPSPKWESVGRAHLSRGWRGDLEKLADPGLSLAKDCFVTDPALAGDYSPRSVRETGRGPSFVELEALGKGRALLVSSEMYFPGWEAWVDGGRRKVEDVNNGFRGVVLGDGEEKVKLVFRPTSFRLGCFIFLLVCGLWAGMILKETKA